MSCSLQSLWRANLLLYLGLFLHCGEARVHTEAQTGPLYRVVGSPLLISCNTSGFISESAIKQFEFRIKKPSKAMDLNIISTGDGRFTYGAYSARVRSKEITATHVSPNSVLFKIESLIKEDEGEYDCTVVNSEGRYDGTYSAKTTVKVIDNSLSVSSPASTSLSYNEGDALTLTCQASSNTVQHTHLSLAWYLHKDGEDNAQLIISLDRDFTLRPGQGFEARYQAGLVRLDKLGEAMYMLKIAELELSDQGRIYCQAQEWIQDPDWSWYSMTQKNAAESTLTVKAKEVVPDTSSLRVTISAQSTTLQEGQELRLSCSIGTQNLEEKFFSVAWFRGSTELARIGPTGILAVGPEYSGREQGGELRVVRIRNKDYRLTLQPVRTEDQGEYICRAWPQEREQNGVFTQGAPQDSLSQRVNIQATESGLSVEMRNTTRVNEMESLNLICKVSGFSGQLSVTWQRKSAASASTAVFTNVVSLSQEGVMETAEELKSRKVKATRPAADTFTLQLDEVATSDSGFYQCTVSEWKVNSKTNSQSQTASVTVAPIESLIKLNLMSRSQEVTVGAIVELMCRVRGPRIPLTLTWSLQRDASNIDNILTLYNDGTISWSGDQHRYQLKVENQNNGVMYRLLINGASHREAGRYQCSTSVFFENVHKKLPPSSWLAVVVKNPVSQLKLMSSPSLTSNINTDVEIKCSVVSNTSVASHYSVTWLLQQEAENKTIISSDRDGIVTFGPQVALSHRQRISMKRTTGPTFELSIGQTQIADGGSYMCKVAEWLQDPFGDWFELSPAPYATTELKLIEPANDLSLDKNEQLLTAMEGDEVELHCNITSRAPGPSFFYKVTWFYTGHTSLIPNVLVELDHRGLLSYPENQGPRGLQGRLRLSRPTQSSFSLQIQKARDGDNGTYQCQVEQYQLDHEGHWQQKASAKAGHITLSINVTESKLSVIKEDMQLNVSSSQNFTIPCDISSQSSSESQLQVTWFLQKEIESKQRPIFTAHRNSTLQDRFGKDDQLRFGHPLSNKFSLTVLKAAPEDSGLYFCEVEEWLPSLSQWWRKVAVEKSGYFTVNVSAVGNLNAVSGCKSGIWAGVIVVILVCTLLVIFLLLWKIRQSKSSGAKKSGQSLWAEQPLKTKSDAED